MSYVYRCEKCDGRAQWRITRVGDVVTTWACNLHLARICLDMQRVRYTELVITLNEHHPRIPGDTPSSASEEIGR